VRNFLQHFVTDDVAASVIDAFEMVGVALKRICSSTRASSSAKLTSGIEVCSFRDIHTGQFFSGSSNPAN
jgi:hypothetical protein